MNKDDLRYYDYPHLLWDPNTLDCGYVQLQRGWDDQGEILVEDMRETSLYQTSSEDGEGVLRFTIIWSPNEPSDEPTDEKKEIRSYRVYPYWRYSYPYIYFDQYLNPELYLYPYQYPDPYQYPYHYPYHQYLYQYSYEGLLYQSLLSYSQSPLPYPSYLYQDNLQYLYQIFLPYPQNPVQYPYRETLIYTMKYLPWQISDAIYSCGSFPLFISDLPLPISELAERVKLPLFPTFILLPLTFRKEGVYDRQP